MASSETHSLRQALLGTTLYGSDGAAYTVRELIGEGGQGLVFLADRQGEHPAQFVIKVLRPDRIEGDTLTRFQREAVVMQRLSSQAVPSPHIVRFYDHMVAELPSATEGTLKLPFTVLEFIDGPTLEREIERHRNHGFACARVIHLVQHVAEALRAVHAVGVIHRDLKPSNILLVQSAHGEIAKVMDFGLAKLLSGNHEQTLLVAGASLGYAPPEQYEKRNPRVGPASDVFSLAAIAFELLSGHNAFGFAPGESPLTILTKMLGAERPSIARYRSRLVAALRDDEGVLRRVDAELWRALAPTPEQRHPSPMAFARALAAAMPAVAPGARTEVMSPAAVWSTGSYARVPANAAQASPDSGAPWTFTVSDEPATRLTSLRAAAFAGHGALALALADEGLFAIGERKASAVSAVSHKVAQSLRGFVALPNHSLVLFGTGGTVLSLDANLGYISRLRGIDPTFDFYAGGLMPDGRVALLARHPQRTSLCMVDVGAPVGRGFTVMHTLDTEVRGCVVFPGGVLCFGDRGSLTRISAGGVTQRAQVCEGNLLAALHTPTGFVVVGSGGHALHVSHELEPTLERVETIRDLWVLAQSPDGAIWAGCAAGRLVVRRGDIWRSALTKPLGTATVSALWATPGRVVGLLADGRLFQGARAPSVR